MAVLLSVPITGTHFMRATLDWLGIEYENFHPTETIDGGWRADRTVDRIPNGARVAPLRDPLLAWISYIQRCGGIDWRRAITRGYRIGFMPRMGIGGNVDAWKWLFDQDIAAFVRIQGSQADHAADLDSLIAATDATRPPDFDDYVSHWKKAGSHGDDHELKRAYFARDLEMLAPLIDQMSPIIGEFHDRGCQLWWDAAETPNGR